MKKFLSIIFSLLIILNGLGFSSISKAKVLEKGINQKYDYLIVGSGLTGSIFAYEATKKGKNCLVIDKRNHVGGTVYTENIAGINVHKYGAHIFRTSNKKVWDYMNQFAEFNNFINSPIAIYKDELYNLPFNMNTFSKMWNVKTPKEAQFTIEKQIKEAKIETPQNLKDKAISLVGKDIYKKLIKGYTEKQWGRSCKELPSSIIKRLPVRFTYNNNYFNDRYQGVPIGGYTQIIQKMLEKSDVLLNTDYFEFIKKYPDVSDKIIYTGEIDRYYGYCYGRLDYRSLRFEHKILETENYQGNAVVNYTERNVPYTRIIEHKHFEFGNQPNTVITEEYPQQFDGNNEPYYPINDQKNTLLYQKYKNLADKETKVIFCGRLGQYKYIDMNEVIEGTLELCNMVLNTQTIK